MNAQTNEAFETLHKREQAYRMTIARLLDALERYPDDLGMAKQQGDAILRQQPLWSEIADAEDQS